MSYRLQLLFDNVYSAGGEPYSIAQVARLASTKNKQVTKQQIQGILSGRTKRPAFETIAALWAFFKVPPDYFATEDEETFKSYEDYLKTIRQRVDDQKLLAARVDYWNQVKRKQQPSGKTK